MAVKVNVILFDININGTVVKEVLDEQIQKDPENVSVEKFKTVAETIQYFETIENAIVLFCVSNGDGLLKLVDLTKKLKPMMKKGFLKVCGFNDINNQKVDLVLKKAGITDILDPSLNKKTFQYKINFWAKSLRKKEVKSFQTNEEGASSQTKGSFSGQGKNSGIGRGNAAKKKKNKGAVNKTPPLDLEEDCWLLKSPEDCKLILNKWLIRLLGPGPGVCKWDQVKDKNNPSAQVWKFGARRKEDANDELFFFEDGAWFFVGQKPEFEWETNRWIFTSNIPSLIYVKGEEQFNRFIVGEDGMEMAENSIFAKTKEESIWQTIEMEKDFNNEDQKKQKLEDITIEEEGHSDEEKEDNVELSVEEGDSASNGKSKFSNDGAEEDDSDSGQSSFSDLEAEPEDLGGHYAGDGEAEHIDGGTLSGKTDGTDYYETDGEAGRFENEDGEVDGHLEGEGKTERINSGPLKGKIKNGESGNRFEDLEGSFESEEYPEGKLEGDIGTEKINKGPLKGKVGADDGGGSRFEDLEGSFESESHPDGQLEGDIEGTDRASGSLRGEGNTERKSDGRLKGNLKSSFADMEETDAEDEEYEEIEEVEEIIDTIDDSGKPVKKKQVKKKKVKKKRKKMRRVDPITGNFVDVNEDDENLDKAEEFDAEEMPKEKLVGNLSQKAKIKKGRAFASLEEEKSNENEDIVDESTGLMDRGGDNSFNMPETDLDEESIPDTLPKKQKANLGLKKGETRYRGFSRNRDEEENPFVEESNGNVEAIEIEDASEDMVNIPLDEILDQAIEDLNLESGEMTVKIERLDENGDFLEIELEATLDDLYENNLILKTMNTIEGINVDDQVKCTLSFYYEEKDVSASLEGLIEGVDLLEGEEEVDNETFLAINLVSFNQEELDAFLTHYSGRQENIVKFMKMTKGDEAA